MILKLLACPLPVLLKFCLIQSQILTPISAHYWTWSTLHCSDLLSTPGCLSLGWSPSGCLMPVTLRVELEGDSQRGASKPGLPFCLTL